VPCLIWHGEQSTLPGQGEQEGRSLGVASNPGGKLPWPGTASSPGCPNPWRGEHSEQGGQRGKEGQRSEQAARQGGATRRGGGVASRRRGKEDFCGLQINIRKLHYFCRFQD
jgi:hypothetical protein